MDENNSDLRLNYSDQETIDLQFSKISDSFKFSNQKLQTFAIFCSSRMQGFSPFILN